MIDGLYSSISTMTTAQQMQDIIAHNLANVNTTGYKGVRATITGFAGDLAKAAAAQKQVHGLVEATKSVSLTPGNYHHTGNALDCAIEGEGFFVIKKGNAELYTRRGTFQLTDDGTIVDCNNRSLMSGSGDLTCPRNIEHSRIRVLDDGLITAGGARVGTMRIVSFAEPKKLIPVGNCAFRYDGDANDIVDAKNFKIKQGYIEQSNVNAVDSMVRMIATLRGYQTGTRGLKAIDESLEKLIQTAT